MSDEKLFNIFDADTEPTDKQLSHLMMIVADKVRRRAKEADLKLFNGIRFDIEQIANQSSVTQSRPG